MSRVLQSLQLGRAGLLFSLSLPHPPQVLVTGDAPVICQNRSHPRNQYLWSLHPPQPGNPHPPGGLSPASRQSRCTPPPQDHQENRSPVVQSYILVSFSYFTPTTKRPARGNMRNFLKLLAEPRSNYHTFILERNIIWPTSPSPVCHYRS